MANKTVNTGASGSLRAYFGLLGGSDSGNYSDIEWEYHLIERVSSPTTWSGGGIGARVRMDGVLQFDGTFGFDWRPSGLQTTLIASGTVRIYHDPDGSKNLLMQVSMENTGTIGAGGPTAFSLNTDLPVRKVVPGTPTGLTATRVSDTQIGLSWSQSSASNGQPTSNTIQRRVNGGAWETVATIAPATSTTVSAAANQKLEYRVRGNNSAGSSAWSTVSTVVYTTPAAPTGLSAAKNASLDIVLNFTPHVAFSEHEHQVWHGTVTGGVTTWDGSPLATLASGVTTYTHTAPDSGEAHVYRVRATAGSLSSSYAVSNTVQLLAAPNKPTIAGVGPYVDRASDFDLTWTHNPVDTTPQSAYEVQYSTNGGSSWSTTGKTTSTVSEHTFTANTYTANQALTVRVRTWGEAETGGSDGEGASPWSDSRTVTFKTRPVVTIITPEDESTIGQALVNVALGFSQAEGASFVSATITFLEGSTTLETKQTTTLAGTVLNTRVVDGGEYTVQVTVKDSNGLVSTVVESTFEVEYLPPVAPVTEFVYLEDQGRVQVGITIPEPGDGETAAVNVRVTRAIDGVTETVVPLYPALPVLTFLDTTPTIQGDNEYTVTTISLDGSETTVTGTVTVAEEWRAFLSKGAGFEDVVVFGHDLSFVATPTVDQVLVKAAGRSRPIGMYATSGDLVVSVAASWDQGVGSTPDEIEALLGTPGRCCYRDPSGRRIFGQVTGQVSRKSSRTGGLSFTVTETS